MVIIKILLLAAGLVLLVVAFIFLCPTPAQVAAADKFLRDWGRGRTPEDQQQEERDRAKYRNYGRWEMGNQAFEPLPHVGNPCRYCGTDLSGDEIGGCQGRSLKE